MVARNSAGSCMLLLAVALALGACGRKDEAAPAAAPEPPPAAPAEATTEVESAPAPAAPEPSRQETPSSGRDAVSDEEAGSFAEPPAKDDLRTAEAELERARHELDSALGVRRARPATQAGAPGAGRSADADRPEAAPAPKAEKKASETGCPTACRAFSSLGRAASAVCRLAGEKDTRCTRAHGMVADAEKRVAVCGCRGE